MATTLADFFSDLNNKKPGTEYVEITEDNLDNSIIKLTKIEEKLKDKDNFTLDDFNNNNQIGDEFNCKYSRGNPTSYIERKDGYYELQNRRTRKYFTMPFLFIQRNFKKYIIEGGGARRKSSRKIPKKTHKKKTIRNRRKSVRHRR